MSECHLLVGRDIDDLWFVVHGHRDQEDFDYPGDWIAEGVGTWQRAMFYANDHLKRGHR